MENGEQLHTKSFFVITQVFHIKGLCFVFQGGEINQAIFKQFLTIYHNVAQTGKHTNALRKAGLVDLLMPVLQTESGVVRRLALSILADLVDETEAHSLEANRDSIRDLIRVLQQALDAADGRSPDLWSSWEVARG